MVFKREKKIEFSARLPKVIKLELIIYETKNYTLKLMILSVFFVLYVL
jgi:hypothetical protein